MEYRNKQNFKKLGIDYNPNSMVFRNPLLLNDGSIVVNSSDGSLIKISKDGKPV